MSIFKGKKDLRIKFSPFWTLVNFCVSSTQILVIALLLGENLRMFPIVSTPTEPWFFSSLLQHRYVREFFGLIVGIHILSGLLSAIFIFYDSLCCWCCQCWFGEGKCYYCNITITYYLYLGDWAVFDPKCPEANLVWKSGEIVVIEK